MKTHVIWRGRLWKIEDGVGLASQFGNIANFDPAPSTSHISQPFVFNFQSSKIFGFEILSYNVLAVDTAGGRRYIWEGTEGFVFHDEMPGVPKVSQETPVFSTGQTIYFESVNTPTEFTFEDFPDEDVAAPIVIEDKR